MSTTEQDALSVPVAITAQAAPPTTADPVDQSPAETLYVVGVGASAGGLEALQRLFARMRRTGAFSFVVIQHLSPDFKSVMGELLAPHTELEVRAAEDGLTLEPDTIYLLPAGREVVVREGKLQLTEREPSRGLFLPVDVFLRSLAEDAGPRAVAVILSGTGSDGARGVRAVHEAGGLVLSQSEDSAKFDGMPRNANDTGVVDMALDPEGLADALGRYLRHEEHLGGPETTLVEGDVLSRIFGLLQSESGIDFGEYKSSTVGRRIERRLLLSDSRNLDHYLDKLASDPDELRLLYKDLLIGVTRFFRDPEAFQRLRQDVMPDLVRRLPLGEELRTWVAGCATGEEAYSMAMVISEAFRNLGRKPAFRVFATDVHRASLELAGSGRYPDESLSGIAADLRERYFERDGEGMRVVSGLRERVVFAHHNLLKDAPFTRLDLLTCRNLLIYFEPSAQRRALSLFHFALKIGGVLLLGPSESTGALNEEFASLDGRWKIFRKFRDVRLNRDLRVGPLTLPELPRTPGARGLTEDPRLTRCRELLHRRYLPPTVLVDGNLRLMHSFGGAAELFSHRDGAPTNNLMDLLDGELRYGASAALKRAQKEGGPAVLGGIRAADEQRRVRVRVEAVDPSGRVGDGWLVAFEPDELPGDPLMDDGAAEPDGAHRPPMDELLRERINALESELRTARQSLQVTVEEMETANEELQATNEELIASNEELQSTNEELHSVNEELYTVNAEYQAKINELTELTADVNNLLEGTDVHTLFLDQELRIRKFTPRIGETFNLLPQDVGRRFETFAHSLQHDLIEDVRNVLATQRQSERDVAGNDGRHYFLRILPYSGREDAGGVVLTLIDISALKRAQTELAVSEERYRTLLRSITAVFFTADAEGRFAVPQPEWQAYTGQSWDEHRGEGWLAAFHPEDRAVVRSRWHEASDGRQAFEVEARIHSHGDGDYRWSVVRAAPLTGEGNRIREWVGHVADIHERREAETALRRHEKQIAAIVANSPAFVWVKDPSGRYLLAGQQAQALYGVAADALIGQTDYDVMPLADADKARAMERQVLEHGETAESEETRVQDGEDRTFLTTRFALRDDRGAVYALAGITTDITERKRTVEEAQDAVVRRDRFLAMLSHELRTPLGAILNASNLLSRQRNDKPGPGLEIIRRQARHMARLIDDLLDIGRITRDELNIERAAVDLGALVNEVVEGLRPAMDDAGLSLNLDLPSDGPLCVRGDAVRLRQIVTNLMNNALTYTPRGGRVSVRGSAEDGRAVIAVRDTGVGMNSDEMGRIFELFYQAPQSIDRPKGGLGIGLTLAQRLAQVHGGEITAESAGRGYGSTFRASFPLMNSAEAREALSAPSGRPAHRLRIAIIEDNADIRETLRDLLLLEGHEVFPAEDGRDGLDLVLRERPDLALVDVGLPRLDGYEVARRIKAACGGGIRVVALTGYGRQEDRLRAVEAGFDEHFVKPVEVEALSRLLGDVEARKRGN